MFCSKGNNYLLSWQKQRVPYEHHNRNRTKQGSHASLLNLHFNQKEHPFHSLGAISSARREKTKQEWRMYITPKRWRRDMYFTPATSFSYSQGAIPGVGRKTTQQEWRMYITHESRRRECTSLKGKILFIPQARFWGPEEKNTTRVKDVHNTGRRRRDMYFTHREHPF
jgi:hypothetical protein